MNRLGNEKGVALVTALMLTLISLGICMAILYVVSQSTKTTAIQKRYSNSIAASYGGTEIVKDIIPRLMPYSTAKNGVSKITDFGAINLAFSSNDNDLKCLSQKLKLQSSSWTACSDDNKVIDAKIKPDFTFKLNGLSSGNGYLVYTKIINTVPGNSDRSEISLELGLGVSQSGGVIGPKHSPGIYTIEVDGEKETNATERAMLSVLYAY